MTPPFTIDTSGQRDPLSPSKVDRLVAMIPPPLQRVARSTYRSGRLVTILIAALLLALRGWDPAPVEILRLKTFDLFQMLHPREFTPQPVLIVDIDEESLKTIGQWPWPRTVLADLIQRIAAQGAVVIGLDIIFAEPDRTSPPRMADSVPGLKPSTIADLKSRPDNDFVLAQVLARTPVVLGQAATTARSDEERLQVLLQLETTSSAEESLDSRATIRDPTKNQERENTASSIAFLGPNPRPFLLSFPHRIRSVPELERAAQGHGMLNLNPEHDGVVRRVPTVLRIEDNVHLSLATAMLRMATGNSSVLVRSDRGGVQSIVIGKVSIATDKNARLWIHYAPHTRQRFVSAKDMLSGSVSPTVAAGKLVLIGSSAAGLRDLKGTPLGSAMAGVEIQTQVLENILSQSFLSRPHYALGVEIIGVTLVFLLIIILVPLIHTHWHLLLFSMVVGAMSGGSWYMFIVEKSLIDAAFPIFAALIVYSLITFFGYARAEQERREVRHAFSRYLSPDLVEQVARDPSRLKLGGESRVMTLLFCDIRGFTGISESFDAQELTEFVNHFFNAMTEVILSFGGAVDKYMGDCVMAFWNAPIEDPDHALLACKASLEMQFRLVRLNQALKNKSRAEGTKHHPLSAGIGINTGQCVVGNFGSNHRFDYSVLGDAVNVASRIEGQAKTYKLEILVGESISKLVPELALLELDLIRVVGREVPVRIFALLGDETVKDSARFGELARLQESMLESYRAQRWSEAQDAISRCRDFDADNQLKEYFDIFEERIALLVGRPPEPSWDGIFDAQTK